MILTSTDPVDAGKMGGKGTSLAKLSAAGFPVPGWFVVSPADVVDGDVSAAVQRLAYELWGGSTRTPPACCWCPMTGPTSTR